MIRYLCIGLLFIISHLSYAQDLIQRIQTGIIPIEQIDLVSKNNLAITLQEHKRTFKSLY